MVQTISNNLYGPKMSPENFCYWLQGLFELQPDLKTLTPEQVQMIKQHLMYVFEGKQNYVSLPPSQVGAGGSAGQGLAHLLSGFQTGEHAVVC